MHPEHAPTFIRIIEKKIEFLKETLGIVEANPNITLEDLAELVNHRLEQEEKLLKNEKNVFETDKIFDSVRILNWIRYLIREKNGRIPRDNVEWKD